jgi:hypothetical protein
MTDFLDFAERSGLALFPMPFGQKAPHGIVASFAHDWSRSREEWNAWRAAHKCNFGIVAGPSRIIAVDVDVAEVGPERAWTVWTEWCTSNGLPVYQPHTATARGGWHILFLCPPDLDIDTLRQVPLIGPIEGVSKKAVVELRVKNGFVVAPESFYNGNPKGEASGTYKLISDAPPHPAPDALIAACTRKLRVSGATRVGTAAAGDVEKVLTWMADHDCFAAYYSWLEVGMILRAEFGDDPGFALWQITNDGSCSAESEAVKWQSFSAEASTDGVKIGTLRKRAKDAGCPHHIGTSTESMFSGVAATLPPGSGMSPRSVLPPLPYGINPTATKSLMGNTAAVVADLGRPTVESFIVANQASRAATEAPQIPDAASSHPLFEPLNAAIALIVGNAERAPKTFRASAAVDMLAVLSVVHGATFLAVCARIRAAGAVLPESKLSAAVTRFEAQVSRELRTGAGWATDAKGMPDGSNTDNVAVFVRTTGAELRFNAWSNRVEIRWSESGEWNPMQEKDFNHLLTTGANGQYNFRPRESMLKRALNALAHEATFDPVLERLTAAQAAWDGVPRLSGWLAMALGVPDDAYHAAVGRSLLGGICKRARHPGCKHDDVVILMGPEDTLKSTFCRALAMDDAWFTDSVDFSGSPQNTVPQLFGRVLVELAELDGMERREVQHIKRFLSAQTDNVTLKYEAFTSDHARRCIFVGTSNESNPLRGDAGNRRFLPVKIEKRIDVDFVRANLDLLMGEAATLEASGDLFLMPPDVIPDARARQESVRAQSDFEIHLHGWFADKTHPGYILPADLASLLKDATGRSVPPNQYGKTMQRLGFESMTPRLVDGTTRVWCRGGMDGAHRYSVHRLGDNRLAPKMMFAGAMVPGGATIVSMVRAQ